MHAIHNFRLYLFCCEAFRLSEILTDDFYERAAKGVDRDTFRQMKEQRIAEFCSSYGLREYERLVQQCVQIKEGLKGTRREWAFKEGLEMVFLALAQRDGKLYVETMRRYLSLGDPLALPPFRLIERLVGQVQPDGAYTLLCESGHAKSYWMGVFLQCLEAKDITREHVERLLEFYRDCGPEALPLGMDFLLRYHALESRIFPLVTRIVLQRIPQDPKCVFALSTLFNPGSEANKTLIQLFKSDLSALKEAYIALSTKDTDDDHDGESFSQILDADPGFLTEYIDARYRANKHPSPYEDGRDYGSLWKRTDYTIIGKQLIEHIYECEGSAGYRYHGYLLAFIPGQETTKVEATVAERQDEVLQDLISQRHEEAEFMRFLFGLISEFAPERRRSLLVHFLGLNKNFKAFENLPLEPDHWSWGRSAVPMYQERVEYFESLLPLLDTAALLKHKQRVEAHIRGLRMEIEREKKRDFSDID